MSIRIKNVNLNLPVEITGRNLIVAHNGISGICGAALLKLLSDENKKDTVIQVDVNGQSDMTDNLIIRSLESINNLSLNMFETVYIVSRATCSEMLLRKLFKSGVKRVVHIDNHITNLGYSLRLDKDFDMYSCHVNSGYSAAWNTFEYISTKLPNKDYKFIDNLRGICAIVDYWWTAQWSNVNAEDPLGEKVLTDLYDIVETKNLIPLDTKAVELNYIYKFEEIDTFFFKLLDSFDKGSLNSLYEEYTTVIERYKKLRIRTEKYIYYAFKDSLKNEGLSKKFNDVLIPQKDIPNFRTRVLVVSVPLNYKVASLAAQDFLSRHTKIVLIYRTKDSGVGYSVRSYGDIDITDFVKKLGGGNSGKNAGGFVISKVAKINEAISRMVCDNIEANIL